jgi:hypothetical protein
MRSVIAAAIAVSALYAADILTTGGHYGETIASVLLSLIDR